MSDYLNMDIETGWYDFFHIQNPSTQYVSKYAIENKIFNTFHNKKEVYYNHMSDINKQIFVMVTELKKCRSLKDTIKEIKRQFCDLRLVKIDSVVDTKTTVFDGTIPLPNDGYTYGFLNYQPGTGTYSSSSVQPLCFLTSFKEISNVKKEVEFDFIKCAMIALAQIYIRSWQVSKQHKLSILEFFDLTKIDFSKFKNRKNIYIMCLKDTPKNRKIIKSSKTKRSDIRYLEIIYGDYHKERILYFLCFEMSTVNCIRLLHYEDVKFFNLTYLMSQLRKNNLI